LDSRGRVLVKSAAGEHIEGARVIIVVAGMEGALPSVVAGLVSAPVYDGAMFVAYLTIIPALGLFVTSIETSFFEDFRLLLDSIQGRAPPSQRSMGCPGIRWAMAMIGFV
jgi:hypothetical protein